MNSNDLRILTQRKNKLLKLIANQFSLKKHERCDVNDLHNRLNHINTWLEEPVVIIKDESWIIKQEDEMLERYRNAAIRSDEYFWSLWDKRKTEIQSSNTTFSTTIGTIRI